MGEPIARVRVLQSVAAPGPTTKYVDQVVREAPEDIEFRYFSWRNALFGDHDVFHVHWPEYFVRGGSALRGTLKRTLFRLFLARLRGKGTPVVRTVHNLEPHLDIPSRDRRLLERLDAMTTIHVVLNGCTPQETLSRPVLIPHGDYREQFRGYRQNDSVPGRMIFVGRIERYKGVPELIETAGRIKSPDIELRVVGNPTPELRDEIVSTLGSLPEAPRARITARLEFVTDEAMVDEITRAQLVVLPYREMHNSGVVLVALSLSRPVLVPDTCVNRALADEVGAHWVRCYEGELTDQMLLDTLADVASAASSAGAPDLSGRDWQVVAESYARVFREAAGSAP